MNKGNTESVNDINEKLVKRNVTVEIDSSFGDLIKSLLY